MVLTGRASHPCSRCGEPTLARVTRLVEGRVVRWRECPSCGYQLLTEELEIGEDVGQLNEARWDYANRRRRGG